MLSGNLFFFEINIGGTFKMIKLCITGGSGFIGTTAMDWAISSGINVVNFDINPPKILSHHKYWKSVDLRDFIQLSDAISNFSPTHILHLAATTGMDVLDIEYFSANTLGVKNLIEASKPLKSLKRVLFTSSLLVCVNGYIPKNDNDYCPPNLYGESKMIGEMLVRDSTFFVPWCIVRPTSVWGPWFSHSYLKFFQMIGRNLYFHIGKKSILKPQTYVGNTVYMMRKILLCESSVVNGCTYYLADYPEITTRQWADTIASIYSSSKRIFTIPYCIIRVCAFFGDFLKMIGISDPPITSFRLRNMITGAAYPISSTMEIVGQLPYSCSDGVSETIAWMSNKKLI